MKAIAAARLAGASMLLMGPSQSAAREVVNIDNRQVVLTQDLCAKTNTGTGSPMTDDWQSNGLCKDYCVERNFAFAIVQWQSCWCSNIHPAESNLGSVSSDCNVDCPGYPSEKCGSEPNWYGYLSLNREPTSTQGGGSRPSSTSTSSTSTTSASSSGEAAPSTTTQDDDTETAQSTASSPSVPAPAPPSTQTSGDANSAPTQSSERETITVDGTVRTIFVTPGSTPTGTASANSDDDGGSSGGLSTGSVVGVVVGVIGGVVAIAGLILFFFLRRRKQQREDDGDDNKYDNPSHRSNSSTGMHQRTAPEMVVTVDGRSMDPEAAASEQRRSRLMATDPRMDPFARPMAFRNKSHESINTLRDDHDYSRKVARPVLRTTNPDPVEE